MKIAVIGGGASGLVTAIIAAREKKEVLILERNQQYGKKILMTGNGRCNYWNEDQNLEHYHSRDWDLLKNIITEENKKQVKYFFDSLGIVPKIKNGYYYPYSNQATSIQSALFKELNRQNVSRLEEFFVKKIEKKKDQFIIYSEDKTLVVDQVILATGSSAYPKTGSDGNGYQLAKSLGHSLVQLKTKGKYLKEWNGIRMDVKLTLYIDQKEIKKETGEIQFTNYGISGICVFNLSGFASKALALSKKVKITMNCCPFIDTKEELNSWLSNRRKELKMEKLEDLLEGCLNYKWILGLLKELNFSRDTNWKDLTKKEKERVVELLFAFPLEVYDTNSFLNAQVCSGGVPLSEINPKTMESSKVKNLYLVGEILDVDGDCGGYNLGFAWISGIIAGKGCCK